MKTFTSILVAAALIAPSMAAAQRHTTPGTAERHARNLAETKVEIASEQKAERLARDEQEQRERNATTEVKEGETKASAPAVRDSSPE